MMTMKNCILTPTFEGHFKYIDMYLKTYKKYVVDSHETPIAFILSDKNELKKFQMIIAHYIGKMTILTYDLETILKDYGITEKSSELLKKYGGRSYQTLKKIYGMLYIDAERFLVIDSESARIDPVNMSEEFDSFFESPFIVVSEWSTRLYKNDSMEEHFAVADYVSGKKQEKMLFEHFMWFYKKSVILDMCNSLGYPIDLIKNVYSWENERGAKKKD